MESISFATVSLVFNTLILSGVLIYMELRHFNERKELIERLSARNLLEYTQIKQIEQDFEDRRRSVKREKKAERKTPKDAIVDEVTGEVYTDPSDTKVD